MKTSYQAPELLLLRMTDEDILTTSLQEPYKEDISWEGL